MRAPRRNVRQTRPRAGSKRRANMLSSLFPRASEVPYKSATSHSRANKSRNCGRVRAHKKTNGPPVQLRGPFVSTVKETARVLAGSPSRALAAAARLTSRSAAGGLAATVAVATLRAMALLLAAGFRSAAAGLGATARLGSANRLSGARGGRGAGRFAAARSAAARLAAAVTMATLHAAALLRAAARGRGAAARLARRGGAARGLGSTTRGLTTTAAAKNARCAFEALVRTNRPATSNAGNKIRDFMTRTPKQKLEGIPVIRCRASQLPLAHCSAIIQAGWAATS